MVCLSLRSVYGGQFASQHLSGAENDAFRLLVPQTLGMLRNSQSHHREGVKKKADCKSKYVVPFAMHSIHSIIYNSGALFECFGG